MIKSNIIISILFFLISICSLLAQEEENNTSISITTVAVIDIKVIYTTFPNEAKGYNSLVTLKERYQKEIDEQIEKLNIIKQQRQIALQKKLYNEAINYEKQINNLSNYIDSLSSRRQDELLRLSKLPISKVFLDRLQKAIEFVAQENGFTVVLNTRMEGLQWWAPVVDITEKVIEKLKL